MPLVLSMHMGLLCGKKLYIGIPKLLDRECRKLLLLCLPTWPCSWNRLHVACTGLFSDAQGLHVTYTKILSSPLHSTVLYGTAHHRPVHCL